MTKLKQQILCACTLASSVLISQNVLATAFLPQDPRALGMGGVGVAAGNSAQAHFYNPSLLHNARADEDFNFEIPGTIRASDSDHLIQSMKDFDDEQLLQNFTLNLNDFITDFSNFVAPGNPNPPDINSLENSRISLLLTSNNLQTGIHDITGKSISLDANVGAVISLPNNQTISWAFYVNYWGNLAAQGNLSPSDDITMDTLIDLLGFSFLDPDPGDLENKLTDIENLNADETLSSTITMNGVTFQEFGLTLASKYVTGGYDIDIGITPKFMQVTTYDEVFSLEDIDDGESNPYERDLKKTYNSYNFDLGISKQLTENWKSGIVVKNLIPQSFKTPSGLAKARLEPAARVGVAYANDWIAVGADLDLTENADVISHSDSQFFAIGAELDVWLLKLRAGYRANLSAKGGNVPSVGLGLYLFGLNVDAAVAANQLEIPSDVDELLEYDDLSASLQIGLQF